METVPVQILTKIYIFTQTNGSINSNMSFVFHLFFVSFFSLQQVSKYFARAINHCYVLSREMDIPYAPSDRIFTDRFLDQKNSSSQRHWVHSREFGFAPTTRHDIENFENGRWSSKRLELHSKICEIPSYFVPVDNNSQPTAIIILGLIINSRRLCSLF